MGALAKRIGGAVFWAGAAAFAGIFLIVMFNGTWPGFLKPVQSLFATLTHLSVAPGLPLRLVHASRGKGVRAEPVAVQFEARRCLFAGRFPELEDQLTAMTADGFDGRGSPDRADAMVWALTELVVRAPAEPRVRAL